MGTTPSNNNFQWRPNDNSVTTNLRYDLEVNHWLKSLRSSTVSSTFRFSSSFVVIGLIISLFLNIIFLILISLSDLLSWIVGKTRSTDQRGHKRSRKPTMLSDDKLNKMWESRKIVEDDTS